ncbi:LOW QUALITY PROTEIN: peptide N-acetyl-beta-D-glucosaminyl asparaginase amidase A-domain-containing protein [Microdochium trichocladiopsis]|uniref:Peptide N-acetyl-beta-D-glucosaminyl asparaginase amidase A-domain-containing protein n=1 Tax=Microdochium trichocladiopsis TaxID=1682393 RepID=A0A9P8XPK6_9PEZI|nr:LOW QUALITY PROTEIN: peptide N-acetyl-beta-D-glucosaminyl asparaginase amidase A-domain-containing protein [Microdochium trichocladiopsis]KAH7009216.1 LOW QUALITY PROTEIN: peptide N-acetyl-beta-D-glucosaminyl asparaginase amidase A-domain-containing protein [Microdochium trichocladiopsis]
MTFTFDRLALMFFGDTEVWRTPTAEPVKPPGIRWTDMSHFFYFWKSPQRIIFDLGNLKYTGTFNTTLTASFYRVIPSDFQNAEPADLIVPISSRKGSQGLPSHFVLPGDQASNSVSLPRNINRAVLTVSANGQAAEEFWWSNVLESDKMTFAKTYGAYPGRSPFREVQVLVDGHLAGVSWPFPVIFTGGVTPSLHRPIVGLQAFDLREHQIDISPWLPLLCDGHEHEFAIRVMGVTDNGVDGGVLSDSINDSWYVTGKVFLWLDDDGRSVTTGSVSTSALKPLASQKPVIHLSRAISRNETGFNETLSRLLDISATVRSQRRHSHVRWTQKLEYTNAALVKDFGFNQVNDFRVTGLDEARGLDQDKSFETFYEYPLHCNQSISSGDMTIQSTLVEGLQLKIRGSSVLPMGTEGYGGPHHESQTQAAHLQTLREGQGEFFAPAGGKASSGFGSTNQLFYFGSLLTLPGQSLERAGKSRELYFRNVTAVNGSIVADEERSVASACHNIVQLPQPPAGNSQDCGGDEGVIRVEGEHPPSTAASGSWFEFAEPLAHRQHFGRLQLVQPSCGNTDCEAATATARGSTSIGPQLLLQQQPLHNH